MTRCWHCGHPIDLDNGDRLTLVWDRQLNGTFHDQCLDAARAVITHP